MSNESSLHGTSAAAWPWEWCLRVWPVALTTLWDGLIFGMLSPFLPYWVFAYGKSVVYVGLLNSARFMTLAVGYLVLGTLSDKFGCRRVLVICVFFLAATLALMAQQETYEELVLGCMLLGLFTGTAPMCISFSVQIARVDDRSTVIGVMNFLAMVGFLLGPIISSMLFDLDRTGPIFLFMAACSAVCCLACFFLRDIQASPHILRGEAPVSRWTVWRSIATLAVVRTSGYTFPLMITFTVLPELWAHVFHRGPKEFAQVVAAVAFMIVVANAFVSKMARKLGDTPLLLVAMVLVTVHWAVLARDVGYVAFVSVTMVIMPTYIAIAMTTTLAVVAKNVPERHLGEANGALQAIHGVFQAVLPTIAALLYAQNRALLFLSASGMGMVSMLLLIYLPPEKMELPSNQVPLDKDDDPS